MIPEYNEGNSCRSLINFIIQNMYPCEEDEEMPPLEGEDVKNVSCEDNLNIYKRCVNDMILSRMFQ